MSISLYSVQMQENSNQKNSKCGHFSHSANDWFLTGSKNTLQLRCLTGFWIDLCTLILNKQFLETTRSCYSVFNCSHFVCGKWRRTTPSLLNNFLLNKSWMSSWNKILSYCVKFSETHFERKLANYFVSACTQFKRHIRICGPGFSIEK